MTTRATIAAVWALALAVVLYVFLRVVQAVLYPEPNPATIVWSAHAGYFWRAWIAAYGGVMGGVVAFVLARRDVARAARPLPIALAFAGIAIAAQGTFLP